MQNILKPLAKSILMLLGLTAAPSTTDATIHKKKFESGITPLITSNQEMNNIKEIIKSLQWSGLLINDVSETIQNEGKI